MRSMPSKKKTDASFSFLRVVGIPWFGFGGRALTLTALQFIHSTVYQRFVCVAPALLPVLASFTEGCFGTSKSTSTPTARKLRALGTPVPVPHESGCFRNLLRPTSCNANTKYQIRKQKAWYIIPLALG